MSQAFLPGLRERGGDLVFLTSTAAHDTYPGGGGYVAAKHAERIIANTLRLELVGEPVRVIEIAPGMVATEEFSLNRLHGDAEAAAKVYAGVAEPLSADDAPPASSGRWSCPPTSTSTPWWCGRGPRPPTHSLPVCSKGGGASAAGRTPPDIGGSQV